MTWTYAEHSEACGIYCETTCFHCLLLWPGTDRWKERRSCGECGGMGFMPGDLNGRCLRCNGHGDYPAVPREVEQDVTGARRR